MSAQLLAAAPASVRPVPAAAPRMRLTRRGRFVFFGLPVALVLAALLTLAVGAVLSPARASDSSAGGSSAVSVVVQPGDTLWAIAEHVAPGRDPRDVVSDIARLNGMNASRLIAGQDLFVPAK